MNELYFDSRTLLIYLAVKHEGDIDKILSDLVLKNIDIPYEEAIKVCKSLPCKAITLVDYDYPQRLKEVFKPPIVLFYYGDISLIDKVCVGVVGSRSYDDWGKKCTEVVVQDFSKEAVVVSGLAKGIDAIAHHAAISNGGRTIAVLGSGIDNCYPSENQELYEEIKKNHLLISEYPFHVNPDSKHFPMRNRIIAGLSYALYVPQINTYTSGTNITINLANGLGQEIFVAAYPPHSQTVNNQLINEGATAVDSGQQIMDEIKKQYKDKFC